jgi:hypothetical protein
MSKYRYRKIHGWIGLLVFAITTGLALAQQQGWLKQAGQMAMVNQPGLYSVDRFVDGDTIAVDMNGKSEILPFNAMAQQPPPTPKTLSVPVKSVWLLIR